MNIIKKIFCRTSQGIFRVALKLIKIPTPSLIEGEDSSSKVGDILYTHEKHKVLVVIGKHIYASGIADRMFFSLENKNIEYVVFKDLNPNPSIDEIEEGVKVYKENFCDSIVAFGGGSPMDAAKVIAARISTPNKSIPQLKGLMKVKKGVPLLIAIPTTAGTGSECTVAAVVSNHDTQEKYAVSDPILVPKYAILDPNTIKDLPGHLSATTGMDALTHAVEAYIGNSNTKLTKQNALEATKLIMENLEETVSNPHNSEARNNMLIASYKAGIAFTRAYVGYVHAIAHTLGGFYNVPHGLANAIIMPYVLESYGKKAHKKLAELSDYVGLTDVSATNEEKASAFINKIKEMNKNMNIPDRFKDIIKDEDIPLMIKRADKEGNPQYPVPRLFDKNDFMEIYKAIKE